MAKGHKNIAIYVFALIDYHSLTFFLSPFPQSLLGTNVVATAEATLIEKIVKGQQSAKNTEPDQKDFVHKPGTFASRIGTHFCDT